MSETILVSIEVRDYNGPAPYLLQCIANGLSLGGINYISISGATDLQPKLTLLAEERNAAIWESHELRCKLENLEVQGKSKP